MSDINYWISDKLQEVFSHSFLNFNLLLLFMLMHELVLTTTDFRCK